MTTQNEHVSVMAQAILNMSRQTGQPIINISLDWYLKHASREDPRKTRIKQAGGWAACVAAALALADDECSPEAISEAARTKMDMGAARVENKRLVQYIHDLEDALHISRHYNAALGTIPKVKKREASSRKREGTVVVLCSDWHVEERVRPEEINGRNEYSPDIARARVAKLVEGILWNVDMWRSKFLIRDIVVWLGGDLITGYIHDELKQTNYMAPGEAALFCQDLVARELLAPLGSQGGFERIIVPCNYGNHGRSTVKPQKKNAAHTSWEWLMYSNLARTFSEPPFEVHVTEGQHHYMDVYNTRMRFHHGDNVRYYGGVGGITIPLNKALHEWNNFIRADITCIGHYHTFLPLPHAVVNGSLIGYNEFALSIKASFEPPQQAIFLVDSERGMRHVGRIWVNDDLIREK